jgi:ectoine hydroxylase-related dioxygenase (phytanoyl-CoA dioxygenase family)
VNKEKRIMQQLTIEEVLSGLGVTSHILSDVEKKTLDEKGYLLLPNIVDREWLAELRAGFEEQSVGGRVESGNNSRQESGTRHVNITLDWSKAFEHVYTHPKLLAIAHYVLKTDFRLSGLHGRDPLPGFGQQGLHADRPPRHLSMPYESITSICLLDDFSHENGATRLVPGSHAWEKKLDRVAADPNRNYPGQLQIEAAAGSVLVFNAHLWHSGMRNLSKTSRCALICAFTAAQLVGFSQPTLLHPEKLDLNTRYLLSV